MAQQGKQMRVGACEGFAYHSVKLVLLANSNRCEVDSNTVLKVAKPAINLKFCPVTILTFLGTHSHL
jgi:hypothetical protein